MDFPHPEPTVELQRAGSSVAIREFTGESASNVAVATQGGVVLVVWTTGMGLRANRFDANLGSLDSSPLTLEVGRVRTPRASVDGSVFLVVWARETGPGTSELRFLQVPRFGAPPPATTLRVGPLGAPEVAGVKPGDALVAWAENIDGGWYPFAWRLGVTPIDGGTPPDAGAVDAGGPDAGATDAGAMDAGVVDSGIVDAGAMDAGEDDAGHMGPADGGSSVDAGPGARRTYGVGCTGAPASLSGLGVVCWLMLLRRRRG
ncbi:MAG: hypothetical protein AB1938_20380 [Myxococcota bacterium]